VLDRVAGVCLRLLILFVTLWALTVVVQHVSVVLTPLAIALLLSALLMPLVRRLQRRGLPRWLATLVSILLGLAFVGGLGTFVVYTLANGVTGLQDALLQSVQRLHQWLVHGPLPINEAQLNGLSQQAQTWFTQHRQQLASGVFGVFTTLADLLVGAALALFSLIFLLYDGPRIWRFLLPFHGDTRSMLDLAGHRVFRVLSTYVRVTVLVAIIDAAGIGVGLFAARVPLALPLAALVFLGAFVPIVGAFVSGLIAVVVALVTKGLVTALIVLAVVVGVQQLEGNVLHPFLTAGLVRLHPLAVLLSVTLGTTLAGIIGALLAVPVVASVRVAVRTTIDWYSPDRPTPGPEPPPDPELTCVPADAPRRARPDRVVCGRPNVTVRGGPAWPPESPPPTGSTGPNCWTSCDRGTARCWSPPAPTAARNCPRSPVAWTARAGSWCPPTRSGPRPATPATTRGCRCAYSPRTSTGPTSRSTGTPRCSTCRRRWSRWWSTSAASPASTRTGTSTARRCAGRASA
jgi:putative heme transporter